MLDVAGAFVLVSAAIGAAFGAAQIVLRWRSHGSKDARTTAASADLKLQEVVALGSLAKHQWPAEEARELEVQLDNLLGQLRDRKLRALCSTLRESWTEAWASSPPMLWAISAGGRTTSNDTHARRAMVERQVGAARAGSDAASSVRARCDQLERWIVWR